MYKNTTHHRTAVVGCFCELRCAIIDIFVKICQIYICLFQNNGYYCNKKLCIWKMYKLALYIEKWYNWTDLQEK